MECHAVGNHISVGEAELLDLELYTQIESIKLSRTEGCIEVAPDHVCKVSNVSNGSSWIICLASLLDNLIPLPKGEDPRRSLVFNELVRKGYSVS
tara:strand:- start:638 stop:922 length:285 start_codon:yes stop_codon:yes gene_type:complete